MKTKIAESTITSRANRATPTTPSRRAAARENAATATIELVPALLQINAARALKADLIIISTHAYTGLEHALLGSTTERVVRHAPCPVLVVRERERDFV